MHLKDLPAVPKKILLTIGSVFSLCYLVACFSSYINPTRFFGITYLALSFPLLFVGMIIWSTIATMVYPTKGWLFYLLLIPSYKNISNTVAFHQPTKFSFEKKSSQLRIISWNVNEFLLGHIYDSSWENKQVEMLNFVRRANADILCFQDFVEAPPSYSRDVINYITDSLQFPYRYFSMDGIGYGTIIYSKLPIVDSGQIRYKEKVYPESLAFADIVFNRQKIRIFNTHLRSMYLHHSALNEENIGYPEFVKEDTAFLFHSTRMQRLEYFDRIHTSQAMLIKQALNNCALPFVFCGDLNAVPASFVYQHISKGLNDAFLQRGSGISGTYKKFTPFVRIDVVLTNHFIQPKQFYSPPLPLSDHYPILTDIQFVK